MRRFGMWTALVLVIGACVTGAVLLASPAAYSQALEDLDDDDAAMRALAVQYMASLGTSGIDDLLDELAEDHPPLTTAGLAEAVLRIGIGAGDVEDVALLLASDDPATRHGAVTILATQAAAARTHLEGVATSASERGTIRAAAAAALGAAGAQARSALQSLARGDDVPGLAQKAALQSLARVSADGAKDVHAVAANPDLPWPVRQAAIRALGHPSAPSPGPLVKLLSSTEIPVRAAVVTALAQRGETQDLTLVAGRLTDPAAAVRLAALRGGMHAGTTAANRTAVIGRMLDADVRLKALAAELVGQTCNDIAGTVRPALVSLLASTNFRVRLKAALALYAHGDTSGAATMKTDTLSSNLSQAQQAKQAYQRINGGL